MEKDYVLTGVSVDEAARDVESFCQTLRVSKQDALKYRLSVEEVLNCWISNQVGSSFTIKSGKRLGKPYLILTAKGVAVNPFDKGDSPILGNIIALINNAPVYSYQENSNMVVFNIKQMPMNSLLELLIAIVAAVVLGSLAQGLLPQSTVSSLLEDLINPLYSAAFRLLGCIAGPLILLSVVWGIYGIGDVRTLGKIGKKLIVTFVGLTFLIAVYSTFSFLFFNVDHLEQVSGRSPFATILEMLLDIIPSNIVEPLSSGNTLQIIFTAVSLGIAMLFLGKRIQAVADFVEQVNHIVQFLMGLISKMIPAFVFLIIFRLIINQSLTLLLGIWKLAMIFFIFSIILSTVITLITALRNHVRPSQLIKKNLNTFIIALTTASSAACFSTFVESCEKKQGVDKSLTGLGIPLGIVMFKSAGTIYYMMAALFYAGKLSIPCSGSWLVTAAFLAAMLSIATPPIPGGGVVTYTVLFSRLGIPDDALAIVLSIDMLIDFPRTALCMYNLSLVLVNVASDLKLLNKKVLRDE